MSDQYSKDTHQLEKPAAGRFVEALHDRKSQVDELD
jgi:hypothetical protein